MKMRRVDEWIMGANPRLSDGIRFRVHYMSRRVQISLEVAL